MKSMLLLTVALLASLCSAPALAGTSEDAFARAIADYRIGDARGQWNNPFMPAATGNYIDTRVSADVQIMELVATYVRELLDRCGWENKYVHNANYASGNPLRQIEVGAGITLAATPVQPAEILRLVSQLTR